jgi:hypothetical protein
MSAALSTTIENRPQFTHRDPGHAGEFRQWFDKSDDSNGSRHGARPAKTPPKGTRELPRFFDPQLDGHLSLEQKIRVCSEAIKFPQKSEETTKCSHRIWAIQLDLVLWRTVQKDMVGAAFPSRQSQRLSQ